MNIEWSPLAEEAWQEIANYIYETFGVRALLAYSDITDSWMDVLASGVFTAAEEDSLKHKNKIYHSISIHQLSKIIYYVENDVVYIADVWDTRKSPKILTTRLQ